MRPSGGGRGDQTKRTNQNQNGSSLGSGSSSSSPSSRLVRCHHCSLCKSAGDKRTIQGESFYIWHTWTSRVSIPRPYTQSCTSPRHCIPHTLADSHVTIKRDTRIISWLRPLQEGDIWTHSSPSGRTHESVYPHTPSWSHFPKWRLPWRLDCYLCRCEPSCPSTKGGH